MQRRIIATNQIACSQGREFSKKEKARKRKPITASDRIADLRTLGHEIILDAKGWARCPHCLRGAKASNRSLLAFVGKGECTNKGAAVSNTEYDSPLGQDEAAPRELSLPVNTPGNSPFLEGCGSVAGVNSSGTANPFKVQNAPSSEPPQKRLRTAPGASSDAGADSTCDSGVAVGNKTGPLPSTSADLTRQPESGHAPPPEPPFDPTLNGHSGHA